MRAIQRKESWVEDELHSIVWSLAWLGQLPRAGWPLTLTVVVVVLVNFPQIQALFLTQPIHPRSKPGPPVR